MAIAQEPTKWTMPLGVNADANDIPDTAPDYTGNASMNSVFPQITQLPLEAGGIAPTRADFNGLFKLLGASIYYMQRGGIFSYADYVDYPVGAVVKFENGIYIAIQENGPTGTVADPSEPDYWRHLTTTVNDQYADSNGNVSITSVENATNATRADNGVDSNGEKYIRFINGVQICWGNSSNFGLYAAQVIFEKPFKDNNYKICAIGSISTSDTDYRQTISILYNLKSTTDVQLRLPNQKSPDINYIAIGFWK